MDAAPGTRRAPALRSLLRVLPVVAPLMLVLAASATGCEAIVGSTVPAFTCSDSDPSSCPSGKVCAMATGQCILASKSCLANPCASGLTCDPATLQCVSGVVEAGTSDTGIADSSSGKESGPVGDAEVPPYDVGHTCQKPSDCTTTLCADSAILGQDYFNKVGAVCTIPCCTSEQCGPGLVCVGPGTGGKYCVPAASLKRTLGAKSGGAVCAVDSDCRSGKCIGDSGGATHKVCADSCCSDANCAGTPADVLGAKCRPLDVEGTTHKSYACSVYAAGSTNVCPGPVDSCLSGVCATNSCLGPCCSLSSAVTAGHVLCDSQSLGNGDTYSFGNGGTVGGSDFGTGCSLGTKCKSGYCDKADGAGMGVCSDICCTDEDCLPRRASGDAGLVTWVCRPRTGLTHFLRCVPQ